MNWQLDVAPTADEVYQAMVLAGKAGVNRRENLLGVILTVFTCFFAPMGATMILWVAVNLAGGPDFSDVSPAALPITFALFVSLGFWLMRQSYVTYAAMSLRSRFGRRFAVSIDAEGITFTTDHSRWHSGWADVAAVCGGKTTIAICISAIALPLPRRAFLGPQDAEDALAAMQRWQQAAQ